MTTVEQFLGTSRSLANRNNLPTGKAKRQENFPGGIRKVVLGRMLAQVAIVPMSVNTVTLIGYGGDEKLLQALKPTVSGGTLRLEGQVPFKGGSAPSSNVFGGGMAFAGNVTIMSGNISYSSGGGSDTIVIDGRQVDLGRYIQIGLIVPVATDVKITDLIGAVGVTDDLDGTLDFSPSIRAELVAKGVASVIGDLGGSGKATIDRVTGDAELEVSGSGAFHLGGVGGNIEARISGSGTVAIAGGSTRRMRGSVSGSGRIQHGGTIVGDARLRVSGSGNVNVTKVDGEVDASVAGMGQITANGRVHGKSRW